MLIKSVAACLGFGLALTAVLMSVQGDVPFELSFLGWTLLFSVPVGLSVYLGSLGTTTLQYPSASLAALMLWIITVAPSFILDQHFDRLDLRYGEEAIWLGRWLFALWCFVFALAAGRPPERQVRIAPQTVDMIALAVPITLALAYQIILGRFTNYQGTDDADPGTDLVLAMGMGRNALVCLPGFLLFMSRRVESQLMIWGTRLAIVPSVLLLLLTGGRSVIAFAVGVVFCFARLAGMRFRMRWAAPMVLAIPVFFVIVFNYRNVLTESGLKTVSLTGLTSVASNSATDLAMGEERRSRTMTSFSENLRARLGMGPQFFTVVEGWLADGSALEWTFLDGMIKAIPSALLPDKNDLAESYNFELALQRTGRFPLVDRAPSPWMQWLYELGVVGIILGAALYGFLARTIEQRVVRTDSTFEVLFWAYILSALYPGEATTDNLLLSVRDALALLACGAFLSLVLRKFAVVGSLRSGARAA
jgi:hypothetical protein